LKVVTEIGVARVTSRIIRPISPIRPFQTYAANYNGPASLTEAGPLKHSQCL